LSAPIVLRLVFAPLQLVEALVLLQSAVLRWLKAITVASEYILAQRLSWWLWVARNIPSHSVEATIRPCLEELA
jgi:hypothetical protein